MRYVLWLLLLVPMPLMAQKQTALATLPLNVSGHYDVLTWNEAVAVDGFNIYRSVYSGGPYTLLNTSLVTAKTYTDYGVQNGVTYYYVVTAVSGGQESGYSNQATATVPNP